MTSIDRRTLLRGGLAAGAGLAGGALLGGVGASASGTVASRAVVHLRDRDGVSLWSTILPAPR